MKKKIVLVISLEELIQRTAEEYNLGNNYTSVIDKENGTITITDEEEVVLPDMKILIEQSSVRTAIANKILPFLKGKQKEEITIADLSTASNSIVNFGKGEKVRVSRLKSFYEKYSDKKITEVLGLKFSEIKEVVGYNSYGIPSHQLLTAIFQTIGFTESCQFFTFEL